jgi:hypothetical protein
MEFRDEAHRQAVRVAFLRLTADQSWNVIRTLADEAVYELEQKSLQEDDEEKAATYRHDARGARKFWEKLLRNIELAKGGDAGESWNEVIM